MIDIDLTANYSWIDAGTVTTDTDGANTTMSFGLTFSNIPAVWASSQTYSQGSNVAATVWIDDKTTSASNFVGCVHQETADKCTTGQPTESVGYVAIDLSNVSIT